MANFVKVLHFDELGRGSFKHDVVTAVRAARQAGDDGAINQIWNLWLDYLLVTLPAKGRKLSAFLSRLQRWQTDGDWIVFLAGHGPSVAFASRADDQEVTTLVLLGACYQLPEDPEQWWVNVVQARLRSI